MKKILIIDNYDSFTFNLVQYVNELERGEVTVVKNDKIDLSTLKKFDAIIISPGPGLPDESGQLMEVFKHLPDIPVLGVCLGHQAIAEHFGGRLLQLDEVFHGVDSPIRKSKENYLLFNKLDLEFTVGRYHSWVIDDNSLEGIGLEVTCRDEEGIIMGIKHKDHNIHGVQFHPESVMTPGGRQIISNFLEMMN